MSRSIPVSACSRCGTCASTCPHGAIRELNGRLIIDALICSNCGERGTRPVCVIQCPTSLPRASRARRGRGRLLLRDGGTPRPETHRSLEGLVPFASCLPLWEAANLLCQGMDACQGDHPHLLIERHSQQVRLGLGLSPPLRADGQGRWRSPDTPKVLPRGQALEALAGFDPRLVALHLLLAARAAGQTSPWQETIVVDDRELERTLGLDRRRDLNRPERLSLLKALMLQLPRLVLDLRCEPIGGLPEFTLHHDPLWRLLAVEHHFQTEAGGQTHLAGLTFELRAGGWSRYFLDAEGARQQRALMQYGHLPMALPRTVMRHWQQHPGAVRLLVWLLFKLRLGQHHTLLVSTLMRIAYGGERLGQAGRDRELRKRLVRTYEADLLVLLEEGLRPRFHHQLYPDEIRPLWHNLEAIPDDPEEAAAFWTRDGASERRLTDQGPRNKFRRLLQARIQGFDLDGRWRQGRSEPKTSRGRRSPAVDTGSGAGRVEGGAGPRGEASAPTALTPAEPSLSPRAIRDARERRGLSQRSLAQRMQRSQSWVRDLESGRCRPGVEDRTRLMDLLGFTANG